MGKKPRSQRRKKAMAMEADDTDRDVDSLSESFTVADSSTVLEDDFVDEDEEDHNHQDVVTIASVAANAAATRQSKLVDALNAVQDLASEKRSATRQTLLKSLFRALTQYATGPVGRDYVADHQDVIVSAASVVGLRGGVATPSEQYAACRVLEATAVVLGGDFDDYFEAIEPRLRRVIQTTTRATLVRGAALRALSMTNFCCSSDESSTVELLTLCEQVCAPTFRNQDVTATLRATALDCWALLSTTLEDSYIAGNDDFDIGRGLSILPLLKQCLDHSSVELRSAAGECVALIHETRLNLGIDDEEGENSSERRYRRGSWDGSEWEVLMDEVKQRVAELSVESGHHMSKRAKKEQRATFREFMSTIVHDESPQQVVNFRGGQLVLDSWALVIQLNFCRHCLQGGFQVQLLTNSTLQSIFGADGQTLGASGTMSQLEKRLLLSKTSEAAKAADLRMTRKRRMRTNVKNHFLTADGDDI